MRQEYHPGKITSMLFNAPDKSKPVTKGFFSMAKQHKNNPAQHPIL